MNSQEVSTLDFIVDQLDLKSGVIPENIEVSNGLAGPSWGSNLTDRRPVWGTVIYKQFVIDSSSVGITHYRGNSRFSRLTLKTSDMLTIVTGRGGLDARWLPLLAEVFRSEKPPALQETDSKLETTDGHGDRNRD